MKIKWNKRYTSIALYAAGVCCLLIFLSWILFNLGSVFDIVSSIAGAVLPVFIGFAIAYILNPLEKLFEKKVFSFVEKKKPHPWLRRCLSVASCFLFALIVIGILLICIVPQVIAGIYDLTSKAGSYVSKLNGWISTIVGDSGFLHDQYQKLIANIDLNRLQDIINEITKNSSDYLISGGGAILSFFGSFLGGTLKVILGIIMAAYMLLYKEHLTDTVKTVALAIFPEKTNGVLRHLLEEADYRFGGFIVGQLIDALIVGVLVFITSWILRIPYYPLVSVLCAVTNVIPFFGPFLGAIPSFLIIFVADPLKALIFVGLILVIQQVDGNYICPRILSGSTGLSSLGVILSITIAGGLFGITGMFIGVPFFAVLTALVSEQIEKKLLKKSLPTDTAAYEAEGAPFVQSPETEKAKPEEKEKKPRKEKKPKKAPVKDKPKAKKQVVLPKLKSKKKQTETKEEESVSNEKE